MIRNAVWLLVARTAFRLITFTIVENKERIQSVDLLRGVVMIIMALDHVRDYFHRDAFFYSPTDLSQTDVPIFFTRWITHFCAPVFVFLSGISASLYGEKKGNKALAKFLLTRGFWLVVVEVVFINLFRTFNPSYPFVNLQVLWAIGISMIVLAGLIFLDRKLIVVIGVLLVAGHNLLDGVHVSGSGPGAFLWALLHDSKGFQWGPTMVYVRYPLLPWIGIMALGYIVGSYYQSWYDAEERKPKLLLMGFSCVGLFILLRAGNFYGDADHWSSQRTVALSVLSFFNVTKYPPSLLYTLMTIGPALIFLALTEQPLNKWTATGVMFGRTAMFYYLAHILLIHVLALAGVLVCGYSLGTMVISSGVNNMPDLKGYGFPLIIVYLVWLGLLLLLYPLCKRYDEYKRTHQASKWWLSYL
ncbi:MAG: DUF1624 domain-containing protein [Bacteroidetes bacterium]|nr:DUF1624 domain-containing protein [Bacteroidota bacterium]